MAEGFGEASGPHYGDTLAQRQRTRAFVRDVLTNVFKQPTTDTDVERISKRVEKALGLSDARRGTERRSRSEAGDGRRVMADRLLVAMIAFNLAMLIKAESNAGAIWALVGFTLLTAAWTWRGRAQ